MARRTAVPRRVALAFPIGFPHTERYLRGILDYARAHGPWHFAFGPESSVVSVRSLRDWHGDGIIAMLDSASEARQAAARRIPLVDLSGALVESPAPRVTLDNRAFGRLAAVHLLGLGLRRFGYYGLANVWYALERGRGFRETVEAAGGTVVECPATSSHHTRRPWQWDRRQLEAFLARLRPPVGVFAAHDYRARMVMETARAMGRRIPEDLAVLGVDNDPLTCEFCAPPLSSIEPDGVRVGAEAAALLDGMMASRARRAKSRLIPPKGLTRRESTDTFAVEDPRVAAAVRFIRERFADPIDVARVADHLGVSRRWLEQGFRRCLGVSPHPFICRVRIDRAKELLLETPRKKLAAVARACGFSEVRRMNAVFRRHAGRTPRDVRDRDS